MKSFSSRLAGRFGNSSRWFSSPPSSRLDRRRRDCVTPLLIGRALVRGYQAFLDVKEPHCREYPISVPNAVVWPTGCYRHANVYYIYAIDERQVLHVLGHEPRFLAITPDTGLIDLDNKETSDRVRRLARAEVHLLLGSTGDLSAVAVPLVAGVWFQSSTLIETPVARQQKDGTLVTSFEHGLALWANVELADLVAGSVEAWNKVQDVVDWQQEQDFVTPYPQQCNETRFGTSPSQLRLNYPLSRSRLEAILANESMGDEL